MYIPLVSVLLHHKRDNGSDRPLYEPLQLKGIGGGGGKGGSRGGSSGTGKSSPPAYSPGSPPPPYSVRGSSTSNGYDSSFTIPAGQAFSGRAAGYGTRSQIYGRPYSSVGLLGLGAFPFIFWPLAYSGVYSNYYGTSIYGPADNSSRPGGELQTFTLLPSFAVSEDVANGTAGPQDNTFYLYGDNNSIEDLLPELQSSCGVVSSYGQNVTADPYNIVANYRGNSFSLSLQNYNNSIPDVERPADDNSTLPESITSATPAALPSGTNTTYLDCLNSTIGDNLGLISSPASRNGAPSTLLLCIVLFLYSIKVIKH